MRTLAADVLMTLLGKSSLSARAWPAAFVLVAGAISGCAGAGDETLHHAFTADPGKYTLYSCRDVDTALSTTTLRITELEQLIARASQGTGGTVMAAVAYRSEYNQARSQLRALKVAAAEKQCVANSEYLSRRSVY
jgi:hypothetical protein